MAYKGTTNFSFGYAMVQKIINLAVKTKKKSVLCVTADLDPDHNS